MTPEQKQVADRIVKYFCISVFWMGIGIMSFPVYLPLMAYDFELNGTQIGVILCIPALTQILAVPIIDKLVPIIGIEMTILASGILFGISFISFSLTTLLGHTTAFYWIAIATNIITGASLAANIVGEQALLLKYSLKNEREKNLGMFRAASGVGGLVAPLAGTAFYALGGFLAVFMYVGVGCILLFPFVYREICKARNIFQREDQRANEDDPE